MHSEKVFLDLVDCVYAAAEDPNLWDAFLERIGGVVGSTLNALVFEDVRTRHASVARSVGFDPAFIPAYESYFAARNAWMLAATPGRFGAGSIATSEELLPDAVFLQTEYYTDFLRKMGSRYLVGAFVSRDANALAHLSLIAPKRRGPFGHDDVTLLRKLTPHLRRALELHRRIADLAADRRLAMEALDRVDVGLVVVDRRSRVLLTNRAAEAIFVARDGLSLNPELTAARSREAAALRALVAGAAATGAGEAAGSGGTMHVSRPSMRRPYTVMVAPLRSQESIFGCREGAAVVFVADPERRLETRPSVLRRLYGLTPAESALASRLLEGETLRTAADRLSITLNTAKTHLRHLFEKTGTNRQSELVRVLLMSGASLAERPESTRPGRVR